MDLEKLLMVRDNLTRELANAILDFVREYGEDGVSDYEINEFGLDEGLNGEGVITKIWNFFDNGGCYFFEPNSINSDDLDGINEENYYDKLYEGVTHTAYLCLYIVVDNDGEEHLKYYRFINGGCEFDGDQADPDHDYVNKLPLIDLWYLVEGIKKSSEMM